VSATIRDGAAEPCECLLYVGGEWAKAGDARSVDVRGPFTGEVAVRVSAASRADARSRRRR